MANKKLKVAILEDDSDDHYLTSETLAELDFDVHVDFFTNSNDFFQTIIQAKPGLVLVDYNSTPEKVCRYYKK